MREKGVASYSGNFEVQKAAPLDARQNVPTVAELILAATWTANDGIVYAYKGMFTVVNSDTTPANNGLWWLTASPYTTAENWKQIASSLGVIIDTYDNIKTIKDANSLVADTSYVVSDFATKYAQFGSGLTKTGSIEPLKLIAASTNSFYPEAKSPLFPKDQILYDFDGTINYPNEPSVVADKGVINWRKDENSNSTYYDFPTILWIRDAVDVLTFGAGSKFNSMGADSYDNVISYGKHNVIGSGFVGNTISLGFFSNVVGTGVTNNVIGMGVEGNIFGDYTRDSIFGNRFMGNNILSGESYSGTGFSSNTIGLGCMYNVFGVGFTANVIGDGFKNNTTQSSVRNIDFVSASPTPTHVYKAYNCTIFNGDSIDHLSNVPVLSYFDTSLYAMQYVDPLA